MGAGLRGDSLELKLRGDIQKVLDGQTMLGDRVSAIEQGKVAIGPEAGPGLAGAPLGVLLGWHERRVPLVGHVARDPVPVGVGASGEHVRLLEDGPRGVGPVGVQEPAEHQTEFIPRPGAWKAPRKQRRGGQSPDPL